MKTSTTDITNRELLEAMTQQLSVITDNMVTKKDLREVLQDYPTKRDLKEILKDYATKDDLKRFATKDDMKALGERMERGFSRLERKISASHSANVAHHLETRDMIGDLYRKTAGASS